MSTAPGIASIAYAFPAGVRTVAELAAEGRLQSAPEVLTQFGFGQVHVGADEAPYDLARRAAECALSRMNAEPGSIDAVIYAGTPGTLAFEGSPTAQDAADGVRTMNRFKYPATRLQYELGLTSACAFGVDQLACASLMGAVRLARALCIAEGLERVLCVASEYFPADAGREALFNCTSDAACAVIVDAHSPGLRITATTQVTKGYYWDCDERRDEIIASYFPTSKHVIEATIARAGWTHADVDWVIPHNVSTRSWEILLGLVKLPGARIWSCNIARDGHTLAGDNFINLKDALDAGAVMPGQKLLLFSYGFGAHWTALALEA